MKATQAKPSKPSKVEPYGVESGQVKTRQDNSGQLSGVEWGQVKTRQDNSGQLKATGDKVTGREQGTRGWCPGDVASPHRWTFW